MFASDRWLPGPESAWAVKGAPQGVVDYATVHLTERHGREHKSKKHKHRHGAASDDGSDAGGTPKVASAASGTAAPAAWNWDDFLDEGERGGPPRGAGKSKLMMAAASLLADDDYRAETAGKHKHKSGSGGLVTAAPPSKAPLHPGSSGRLSPVAIVVDPNGSDEDEDESSGRGSRGRGGGHGHFGPEGSGISPKRVRSPRERDADEVHEIRSGEEGVGGFVGARHGSGLIPEGAIALRPVRADPMRGKTPHQVKEAMVARVKNHACDGTGLTRPYYLYVLTKLLIKISKAPLEGEGSQIRRHKVREADFSGSTLGEVGALPLPTKFSHSQMIPDPGVEQPPVAVWLDGATVAQADQGRRSMLLAYIFRSLLLAPVHHLTRLVLDKCELGDPDAAALATMLRFKDKEGLRPGVGQGCVSPPLSTLSLRLNNITDAGVTLLKKAVKYHFIIEEIWLEGNVAIRCSGEHAHPLANFNKTTSFVVPCIDSPHCGGNKEVLEMRRRLKRNLESKLRANDRSCMCL